ncbi:hypothetical protein CINS5915_01070 [Campylobacter insulaenigrae]|uniref:Lipoprotein n=2 Tax=Campylobacter insulaenigrae TaxID=260714 RepID=A0A0A8H445_9BACT|nr:hypothetical protein [Campylobacter insulaenigrae]AJC87669.1 hypothetical protein CINS_0699 [Campylobacter insulaenigrae NCTC 12927]MCR6570135.1 hypothetical protein [Campylobacter insulaenigrae]MCR6571920.1 hypothetical protein [Campylobacter insulaenigrae]MCR6573178.1 hypothetical protein [Campylobacter insulaenigrae]MCR6574965.1 hypothetical protein [Campylobacter insulaenigrae]
MKKILFIFLSTLILIACSNKTQEQSIVNLKSQTLMYAQKINFDYKNSRVVAVISYLNPVLDQKSEKEIFILSLLPSINLNAKDISILVDGKKTQLEILDENDELFKYIIKSNYANYYKITLNKLINKASLQLNSCFENQCFESNFQKISKSVYYRSEDEDKQHN